MSKLSEKQWQAESDLNTLKEADAIRQDKARLRAATSRAKKEIKTLDKLTGQKKRSKKRKR